MQLPKPYPDELAGSVWARASARMGVPLATMLKNTLGVRKKSISLLLGQNVTRIATAMGLDPDVYLTAHTIFPYSVAFMPDEQQRKLREKFVSTANMPASIGSITKVVTQGVAERRFCPLCVSSDLKIYGETYWHRIHHLPGVLTCTVHGCRVVTTTIPLGGKVRMRDRVALPSPGFHELTPLADAALRCVAELSHAALTGRGNIIKSSHDYRTEAWKKGYGLTTTDLATAVFSKELSSFFGEQYLRDAGCLVGGLPRGQWPALMLRHNLGQQFAAPKHIMMRTFLHHASKVKICKLDLYQKPGPRLPEFAVLDQQIVETLCDIALNLNLIGERCTVTEMMTKAGAWQSYRHHRKSFPLTEQFLSEFKRSELSVWQLGGRAIWRERFPTRFGLKPSDGEKK